MPSDLTSVPFGVVVNIMASPTGLLGSNSTSFTCSLYDLKPASQRLRTPVSSFRVMDAVTSCHGVIVKIE